MRFERESLSWIATIADEGDAEQRRRDDAHPDAGVEERSEDDRDDDRRRAEVVAGEHEADGHQRDREDRHRHLAPFVQRIPLARQHPGQPDHQRELDQLRRLGGERAQVDPVAVLAALVAETGEEDQQLQSDADQHGRPRPALPERHRRASGQQHGRDAHQRVEALRAPPGRRSRRRRRVTRWTTTRAPSRARTPRGTGWCRAAGSIRASRHRTACGPPRRRCAVAGTAGRPGAYPAAGGGEVGSSSPAFPPCAPRCSRTASAKRRPRSA